MSNKRSNKKLTIYKMLTISFLQKVTIALLRRWLWVQPHPTHILLQWLGSTLFAVYVAATTSARQRPLIADWPSTVGQSAFDPSLRPTIGARTAKEMPDIDAARELERKLKAKKNPRVALYLLSEQTA